MVFKKGHIPWCTGKKLSEGHCRKIADGNRGKVLSEKTKALMSETRKARWKDPDYRGRVSNSLLGRECSEKTRQQISDTLKRKYRSGEIVVPFKGKKHSEETRKQMSENHYDVSGENNPMYGKTRSEETLRKILRKVNARPNKPEQLLINLFAENELDFKYVGDGSLIVGGKCPDFSDGNNKLIEHYGDYFHKGQDPQDRIEYFKGFGYDTLVIWEHELSDLARVLARVEAFM